MILTCDAPIGAASVPATSQVMVCVEPPRSVAGVACDVTRNGPVPLARTSFVSARPMPPPPWWLSRAVRRKFSVRSLLNPTQSEVGRNSEKQSRMSSGTSVGAGGATGHVPVAAFVLLARIWPRSGNTRSGFVDTAFRPGDGVRSVSVALTFAAVPNCRNSGPLVLRLLTSAVPTALPPEMPPRSFCSHMYLSTSPVSESVALPVSANGVRSGIV